MLYSRIIPGVEVSLLVGNLFYAFRARNLAKTIGQVHVTALPYGINTVSLFAFILFVMKPVLDQTQDVELAWKVGLAACLGSGLIEFVGAYIASWIKRVTTRTSLLATLAGFTITFISMNFCFRIFAQPLVGFVPLTFILVQYIGRFRLPANIPAGMLALVFGTLLAWGLDRMDSATLSNALHFQLQITQLFISDMLSATFSTT